MEQKYKIIIIVVVILIIIGIVIYYLGKKNGKQYVPKDVIIPSDLQPGGTVTDSAGNIIPTYTTPQGTTFNPGPYTDAIYYDLSCYLCLHDSEPYHSAMELSNSQLAAVYNDWNQRYADKMGKETLIQAIKSDFTLFNKAWQDSTYDFVIRLKSIVGTQG